MKSTFETSELDSWAPQSHTRPSFHPPPDTKPESCARHTAARDTRPSPPRSPSTGASLPPHCSPHARNSGTPVRVCPATRSSHHPRGAWWWCDSSRSGQNWSDRDTTIRSGRSRCPSGRSCRSVWQSGSHRARRTCRRCCSMLQCSLTRLRHRQWNATDCYRRCSRGLPPPGSRERWVWILGQARCARVCDMLSDSCQLEQPVQLRIRLRVHAAHGEEQRQLAISSEHVVCDAHCWDTARPSLLQVIFYAEATAALIHSFPYWGPASVLRNLLGLTKWAMPSSWQLG